MRCIDEVPASELEGRRVLLRADFNVPINAEGVVADIFRLKQGWKTVEYLSLKGARVIILTHVGRKPEETTEPIARAINEFAKAAYVPDLTGHLAKSVTSGMKDGEVVLLQNVRSDPRETENDETLARELAALADFYVDDAFAAAHRAHASMVGIPKFLPSAVGFLVRDEIRELTIARKPAHPSLAILGGAKFETKAPLVKTLLENYDHLFITGALANDIFKARGLGVGRSLISKELPDQSILSHPRLLAPIDVTVESSSKEARVKRPEEVGADDKIVDIGPDSVAALAPFIAEAKFILWNGPTGLYEEGYTHYTASIAELISKSDAKKVIGGGDTIAAIEQSGIPQEHLGFLSTGGGAMLEYLLKGTLPAIDALR